jgi:sulfur-carrier protein adenylyltransferase/sulfurtransferase
MNKANENTRYQQQIILKGFGEAAQQKLGKAKVLVIGAGGLGCASLPYLAAAGVGTIGIADDDRVEVTNLHRQVLYNVQDVGSLKASVAADRIRILNSEADVQALPLRLTQKNIEDIIRPFEIIVDGTDNTGSKYMISDACTLAKKPLVFAAVSEFEGQLAVFNFPPGDSLAPNYRDIFPFVGGNELTCSQGGVLGVLPGIMGCMQASEVIKLVTGIHKMQTCKFRVFNSITNRISEFDIEPSEKNRMDMPRNWEEFRSTDYGIAPGYTDELEITAQELAQFMARQEVTLIDVREDGERNTPANFRHVRLPFSRLKQHAAVPGGTVLVAFCEKGQTSMRAALLLKDRLNGAKKIFSLEGGLQKWIKNRVPAWTKK